MTKRTARSLVSPLLLLLYLYHTNWEQSTGLPTDICFWLRSYNYKQKNSKHKTRNIYNTHTHTQRIL